MQHGDCMAFTGRVARLVPLPTVRPIACPFKAAKLPGVTGFWLRGETLANLALLPQADAAPVLQVHLKGRLLLQCSTAPSRFAHVLLTPAQTQRRWLLVARIRSTDEVVFCFQFETEDGGRGAAAAFEGISVRDASLVGASFGPALGDPNGVQQTEPVSSRRAPQRGLSLPALTRQAPQRGLSLLQSVAAPPSTAASLSTTAGEEQAAGWRRKSSCWAFPDARRADMDRQAAPPLPTAAPHRPAPPWTAPAGASDPNASCSQPSQQHACWQNAVQHSAQPQRQGQQASQPQAGTRRATTPPPDAPALKRRPLPPRPPVCSAAASVMVWEHTGQMRSQMSGAPVTESQVAAELASISDDELVMAMQTSMADPAFVGFVDRIVGLWDRLENRLGLCKDASQHV